MLGNSGVRSRDRRKDFKKGIDADESRRRRENNTIQLRRKQREEQMSKRRQTGRNSEYVDALQDDPETANPLVREGLKELPGLVNDVRSSNEDVVLVATRKLRRLLSIERSPPITAVIRSGVVPKLVELLQMDHKPILQFEAAWALTNIASGNSDQTKVIVDLGAVPIFVKLLASDHADVREQAVWAVGNIAGDSVRCRDLVLQNGGIRYLSQLVEPAAKISLIRNIAWTFSNLCRGKPKPDFNFVGHSLPALNKLLQHWNTDSDVVTDACWALSYLSDDNTDNNYQIQAVVQSGVTEKVVQLLFNTKPTVIIPALRTIGNIVTGTDQQTDAAILAGCLSPLRSLLHNVKNNIKKEACWTISNITAGTTNQISHIFSANLVKDLVEILDQGEFDIQKEACWAITNITSSTNQDHIRQLVENYEVLEPLTNMLSCPDSRIIMVALKGIGQILDLGLTLAETGEFSGTDNPYLDLFEAVDGMDKLGALYENDNPKIAEMVKDIVDRHLEEDDDEDAPAAQGDTIGFGGNAKGFNGGFSGWN